MRFWPATAVICWLLAPNVAAAQDLPGFEASNFGKVVLSSKQVAVGETLEAAVGNYNNEYIQNYSANSVFSSMGRAVGRLDILTDKGLFPCTAFIVSEKYILTNHHCVPGILNDDRIGAERIRAVGFVAGYVQPGVQEGAQVFQVIPEPIETSESLDYSVLEIVGNPSADFGMLELSATEPSAGDPYWVIGHPMGEAQRISREKCRANSPALSGDRLLHTCDTLPGNSGSPLIDASHRNVVGLHHAGSERNSINFAIPMKLILEQSRVLVSTDQTRALASPQGNVRVGAAAVCDQLYAEVKDLNACHSYEAYLATCSKHIFAPIAAAYMTRNCSDGSTSAVKTPAARLWTQSDEHDAIRVCENENDTAERLRGCTALIDNSEDAVTLRDVLIERARIHYNSGAPEKSLADIDAAEMRGAMESIHRVSFLLLKGDVLLGLGRYEEAAKVFDTVLNDEDIPKAWTGLADMPRAWIGLAQSQAALGEKDLAATSYRYAFFSETATQKERRAAQNGANSLNMALLDLLLPEMIVAGFYGVAPAGELPPFREEIVGALISDNTYIDQTLSGLLAREEARDYPVVDFDPVVNGQDADISNLKITWRMQSATNQVNTLVTATFSNFDTPNEITYLFGISDGVWKLRNIVSSDWNLYDMLSAEYQGGDSVSQTGAAPIHPCDDAAAHPHDSGAATTGITFGSIDATDAIGECLAANQDYPDEPRFKYQLGRAFDKDGQFDLAHAWYQEAAEQDYPRAMTAIATLYKNGEGVAKNDTLAAEWYQRAATKGDVDGMYELGRRYQDGVGLPASDDKAFEWYLLAAEEGHAKAANTVGYGYATGRGVGVSIEQARLWYLFAADLGEPVGKYNAGVYLDRGKGGPRSPTKAATYLVDAVTGGDANALKLLSKGSSSLQSDTIVEVQRILKRRGVYSGALDGKIGPMTVQAIEALASS